MKLATLRTSDGTVAVLVGTTSATEIQGVADVGALLTQRDWQSQAATSSRSASGSRRTCAADSPKPRLRERLVGGRHLASAGFHRSAAVGARSAASRQDPLCRAELPQPHS